MLIAKGTLLALWLFGVGTMALPYLSIFKSHLPSVGMTVLRAS